MTATTTSGTRASAGNPALHTEALQQQLAGTADRTMSVFGVGIKTLIFLAFVVGGGAWGWASATEEVPAELGAGYADTTVTIPGGFWLASIAALVVGIAVSVNPRRAAAFGALYALLQGFCLGAISAMFDAQTEGIVGAAVVATLCVFGFALLLYLTGIIKPTRKLAFGVSAAMGGLMLLYLFAGIMSLFDWGWRYSDEFRVIGIVVTLLAIGLAALSLTLDFGSIDAAVAARAPKQLEWYYAFGLVTTLIWLYVEILRLFALLNRNR